MPEDDDDATPGTREVAPRTVAATTSAKRRGPGISIGGMIDRYRVLRLLGAGGMGMVYAAHDTELDRQVAVKVMRPELGEIADRLVRESRLMAKVSHPSVITVFDAGRHGDQVFVAMEYVEGATLGGYLGAAPRGWREIVQLFRRAGEGLAAAHRAGLVHRDFKPENVLLALDGDRVARVVVTDLGVARTVEGWQEPDGTPAPPSTPLHVSLTATGVAVGTPAYMAPEQLDAAKVDARADVFAFGVALWEALWGERPFPGRSVPEIRGMIERGPKPPPARPGVRGASDQPPGWLARPLRAALAADPARRPASMEDLLARLDPARHATRARNAILIGLAALTATTSVVGWRWRAHRARSETSWARASSSAPADAVTAPACLDTFAPPWDDAAHASLRALVEAVPSSKADQIADRTVARLDAYAARWIHVRDAVCAPGAPLADLGTQCLALRKDQLAAMLGVLPSVPPADLVLLDQALVVLPGVEVCGTPGAAGVVAAAATPDTPQARSMRGRLDAAAALGLAGDAHGELVALDAMAPDLGALDAPALTAEYDLELAAVLGDSDPPRVIATLRDALAAAEKARLDEDVANVWTELCWQYLATGDLERAAEALQSADAAVVRAGDDPVLRLALDDASAQVHLTRGELDDAEADARRALARARTAAPEQVFALQHRLASVLQEQGKLTDALALDREALDQREAELGADHPLLADAHDQVASDLLMLGDTAGAIAELQRALDIGARAYGDDHLETARYRMNLAEALRNAGEYARSIELHEQARAVLIAVRGDDAVEVAASLENEAGALEGVGRRDDALAQLQRALAIYRAKLGDDAFETGRCRLNLAEALRGLRRLDDALAEDRAGLAVMTKLYGDAHPYVAYAHGDLGKSLLAAGKTADAKTELQAALTIYGAFQGDPAQIADVQLALANALGKDGVALATAALAAFEAAGGEWTDDAAAARAFLAKHGVR